MALSELFFTMYAQVTGRLQPGPAAFYEVGARPVLHALVVNGIRRPYAALADERQRLESILAGTRTGPWE